jgi:hypothetical protein
LNPFVREKNVKKTIILCIAASLLIGWALLIPAAEETGNAGAPAASCPVMGAARELGLLVLGVGWEAARIVLPASCPAKQKDIDGLLHGTPPEPKTSP